MGEVYIYIYMLNLYMELEWKTKFISQVKLALVAASILSIYLYRFLLGR